jgi:serine/threonine protein phosphatase PrpC
MARPPVDLWGFSRPKGRVNEDAYLVDRAHLVFGVFDGLGATSQAALAAGLAARAIGAAYDVRGRSQGAGEDADTDVDADVDVDAERAFLRLAVEGAGELIAATLEDGLTTATVVKICPSSGATGPALGLICNIGDSRVYRYTADGQLRQCTLDDSVFGSDWDVQLRLAEVEAPTGMLEQFYFHQRHILDRCLGQSGDVARLWETDVDPGDAVLALTDGVTDNLTFSEVGRVLHGSRDRPDLAARRLVDAAHARSHQRGHARAKVDDITAVVAHMRPSPPNPELTSQE